MAVGPWRFPGQPPALSLVPPDIQLFQYAPKLLQYVGFDQTSFIREWPFFANKNVTFARLSRTPCLSAAGPMLANNTSYEDSFTTCQVTPENHGSFLDSLWKSFKHAASITESLLRADCCWLGFFFARFTGPPPSRCTLTFARSFP